MYIYRVALIGHRDIDNIRYIENEIGGLSIELMKCYDFVEFYLCRGGDFDTAAASGIKQAQKKYGTQCSSLNLVLPYRSKDECFLENFYDELIYPIDSKTHFKAAIKKRNEWMINNADILICYVEEGRSGGAMTALSFAKKQGLKIINLAHKEI